MKITSDNPMLVSTTTQPATLKGSQGASVAANANATVAKSAQSPGVAVTVSTLARALGSATRSDSADVDMEKVNSVRAAIKNGTFSVNPEAIADKLLGNAQEMLDHTRT